MAFPPPGPKFQKPNAKQWAAGIPSKPPAPPMAPNPPPPPADAVDPNKTPDGMPAPPALAGSKDAKMMARAHKAIGQLLMEGGLPKEVEDILVQASHKLVETRVGTEQPQDPKAEDAGAKDPKTDPAAAKDGAPKPPDAAGAAKPPAPPKAPPAAPKPKAGGDCPPA